MAHAAWLELGDDMRDLGVRWQGDVDSPRRAAAQLLGTDRLRYDEESRNALARLTRAEEAARYAPPGSPERLPDAEGDLRGDVHRVGRALAATLPWPRRWRALLVPPSSLQRVAGVGGKAGDLLTQVNKWTARVWTRLIRRGRPSVSSSSAAR